VGTYVFWRLVQSVVVVFGVVTIVFLIMNLSGDPARLLMPQEASEQDIRDFRHANGLDRPLPEQYVYYMSRAVKADFGDSLWQQGRKAMSLVVERYPATLALGLFSFALIVLIATPLGIISALKPYSFADNVAATIALLGQSMPSFWLGIMLILLFAVTLHVLPSQGEGLSGPDLPHLILPGLTLAAPGIARITRLVRSQMLDVLGEQYVLTARSKGLRERTVILKHALKNAAIPLVTILGLDIGNILAGAVITETVFAWRGVGYLAYQALQKLDFPLVMADVYALSITFVLVNLAVDLLYGVLDPRIRLA
jgi:ABC-type dipeptide/oligopeptide/nickel transport system permease component